MLPARVHTRHICENNMKRGKNVTKNVHAATIVYISTEWETLQIWLWRDE